MDYERAKLNRMQMPEQAEEAQEAESEDVSQADRVVNGGPEAHRAALNTSMPTAQRAQIVGSLQRKFGNAYVQRMIRRQPVVGPEGGTLDDDLTGQINSKRGGGSSLPSDVRREMEQSMGADFSGVRVHNDSASHELNASLGANAFTTGSDIFFGAGKGTDDKSLVAHELTHVVQQGGKASDGPLTVGPADDHYEAEAEKTSASVGTPGGAQRQMSDLQRQESEGGEEEEDEGAPGVSAQRIQRQEAEGGEDEEEEAPDISTQRVQRQEAEGGEDEEEEAPDVSTQRIQRSFAGIQRESEGGEVEEEEAPDVSAQRIQRSFAGMDVQRQIDEDDEAPGVSAQRIQRHSDEEMAGGNA